MESALLTDPQATDRASELRRQMAEIRCTLRDHAAVAADGVRQQTDWRYQVSSHPWISLSVAAAVGYLLVPSRPKAAVDPEVIRKAVREASAGGSVETEKKSTLWTLLGLLIPVVQGFATRSLMAHLENRLNQADVPAPDEEPEAQPRRRPR